jgi:uncharacterized protein YunC (DUF1805 family)
MVKPQSPDAPRFDRTEVEGKPLDLHAIPLGPAALVFARSARGLLGCGAIHVAALQKFGLPAARVRPTSSPSVRDLQDLLDGEVIEANPAAVALGVSVGMTGREALRHL